MLYCRCEAEQQELYVDGRHLLSLKGTNVVLLAETDQVDRLPVVVGSHAIDGDFGVVSLGRRFNMDWQMTFVKHLKQRLYQLQAVREFTRQ